MGGKSKKVTVGYKYHVGAHIALCHGPADAVTHIWVAERLAWSGSSTGGSISINKPDLFGGEKREGGVKGSVDVAMGAPDQAKNSYLMSRLGSAIPAFRGVVSLILKQVYIGTNPYMKPWKVRLRRVLKTSRGEAQWYSSKALINGHDMNPAHIIRECLVDQEWGNGYVPADIDDATFTAAADTLYAEGFGLSFLWEREQTVEAFVQDVLRHIDAALYVHPSTGKFTLKLVRNDYDVGSLPVLDENSIFEVEDFTGQLTGEVTNAVSVRFWDRATGKTASIGVQDIALIQESGSPVAASIEYAGCTTPELAVKLAARDLRSLSSSAARGSILTKRLPASLNVGHAFVLNWAKLGIAGKVMRIASIEIGDHLTGALKLNVVEDVFRLGETTYLAPPPSEWIDPVSEPAPVAYRKLFEMPYRELVSLQGQNTVDSNIEIDPNIGYMAAIGPGPSSDALGAKIYVDSGSGYEEDGFMPFCPSGTLSGPMLATDTSFVLGTAEDLDEVSPGELLQIDNELMAVVTIAGSTVTVLRGILDTVPAPHAAGANVLFWENSYGSDEREYVTSDSIAVKLATTTGKGVLELDSTPADTLTFSGRAARPYPPGNWKICGQYFPTTINLTPLSTTWAHRDRKQQTGSDYIGFLDGSVGPEPGTTYQVTLTDVANNAVIHSAEGITGLTYDAFPTVTGTRDLRLQVSSARDGLTSYTSQTHTFTYIGPSAGDYYWSSVSVLMHFEGTSGASSFVDQKGNTVTAFGGAAHSTAQKKFGATSGYFDGDGDYLTLPSAAAGSITGDFTIEAWVRPTSVGSIRYIARKGAGAYSSGFVFALNASGVPFFTVVGPSDQAGNVTTATSAISTSEWTHVAASKKGNVVRIFVNGVMENTVTLVAAATNNSDPLYVGRDPHNLARDWLGYIDELRITPGICRYNSSFTPPGLPYPDTGATDTYWTQTQALLHFEGANNSTTFTDQKGKTFTATGGAVISTAQSKHGGSSLYLPGSAYISTPDNAGWDFGGGDFTIEVWLRPSSTPAAGAYMGVVTHRASASSNFAWVLLLNGDNAGRLQFLYSTNGASSTGGLLSALPVPAGDWTHCAVVRQGSSLRMYVNGTLSSETNIGNATFYAGTTTLCIGLLSSGVLANTFAGHMDELRITKGVARYTGSGFTLQDGPHPDA